MFNGEAVKIAGGEDTASEVIKIAASEATSTASKASHANVEAKKLVSTINYSYSNNFAMIVVFPKTDSTVLKAKSSAGEVPNATGEATKIASKASYTTMETKGWFP